MGIHVVAIGNAFDGIRIFGPFATGEEAHEWADKNGFGEWNAIALNSPEEAV